ncbi:MAG: T9SS type A sorting domain-containing protein [Bacteroidetes bacterium]|nr:T9SS type A sorting domain-containing protein [Bacteroidota bacterium]
MEGRIIKMILCILIIGRALSLCSQESILNRADSLLLMNLPVLSIPDAMLRTELPFAVNNGHNRYFRSIVEQVGPECGQLSSVSYAFAYEINRLRNLSSHDPENQYPSHFTFNFMNGGNGWTGVSYHHSVEILKTLGCMNIIDYDGISASPEFWISGYDKYYHGMHNRAEEMYQIRVNTIEGLNTLKHYLHNHLEGDSIGGVACFYACSPWNLKTLPAGTPEAGKHVIADWGGPPTHAMTIAGYNDSIRWDYNFDGKYTNDQDINNDGIIDMKDMEIGGLLFADGFFGGTSFADSGFCYMMYKTLAESFRDGGIWNHAVHVISAKKDYTPRLTFKITLKHNSREKIRVLAGVSSDQQAENPEHILGFPVFNYQGGNQYMQGGNTQFSNQIIEFGLDVTPLLSYINPGEPKRFFLCVDEEDPTHTGQGEIYAFSVISYYENGILETACSSCPVNILNDTLTVLPLDHIPLFDQPEITDVSLPVALVGEPYQHAFSVTGGIPPFEWDMLQQYSHGISEVQYPAAGGINITPEFPNDGKTKIPLDFSFPFYGKFYDTLYIHVDGFILFEDQDLPWPYEYDHELLLKKINGVAPRPERNHGIYHDTEGIFLEKNNKEAQIFWKVSNVYYSDTSLLEFSVYLNDSGTIKTHLKYSTGMTKHHGYTGISAGDETNLVSSYLNPAFQNGNDLCFTYKPKPLPLNLTLSDQGILEGIPTEVYRNMELPIRVTDKQGISDTRIFMFTSSYEDITEINSAYEVKIYPNPFSENMQVIIPSAYNSSTQIRLFDVTGKTMAYWELPSGKYFLSLSNLSPGMYYMLISGNGARQIRKIVKQ